MRGLLGHYYKFVDDIRQFSDKHSNLSVEKLILQLDDPKCDKNLFEDIKAWITGKWRQHNPKFMPIEEVLNIVFLCITTNTSPKVWLDTKMVGDRRLGLLVSYCYWKGKASVFKTLTTLLENPTTFKFLLHHFKTAYPKVKNLTPTELAQMHTNHRERYNEIELIRKFEVPDWQKFLAYFAQMWCTEAAIKQRYSDFVNAMTTDPAKTCRLVYQNANNGDKTKALKSGQSGDTKARALEGLTHVKIALNYLRRLIEEWYILGTPRDLLIYEKTGAPELCFGAKFQGETFEHAPKIRKFFDKITIPQTYHGQGGSQPFLLKYTTGRYGWTKPSVCKSLCIDLKAIREFTKV
jgi:hypothetical protein